jgi:hypothetical protein
VALGLAALIHTQQIQLAHVPKGAVKMKFLTLFGVSLAVGFLQGTALRKAAGCDALGNVQFSTVAIQLGKELWVGSVRGDRVARFPMP